MRKTRTVEDDEETEIDIARERSMEVYTVAVLRRRALVPCHICGVLGPKARRDEHLRLDHGMPR